MNVKAVIWDNVGVLWHTGGNPWEEMLGVTREELYRVMSSGPEQEMWDLDEMSMDEFYDFMIKELGLPPEKKYDMLESTRKADNVVINMELYSYIKKLKGRYIQAMLTNYPREWFEIGQKHYPDLMKLFDHIIASFEVKLRKPDAKIYHLALDRIGCKANEAVFIDDTEENVVGAQQIGIHGIHFKNNDQTIKDIEKIIN